MTDRPASELDRLLDVAERPRAGDWSLRAALVRYAQPDPVRVNGVLEVVRRLESALHPYAAAAATRDDRLADLLAVATDVDELGDHLAEWACDTSQPRPDDVVDRVVAEAGRRLDELGIAREEPQPDTARRGRRPGGRNRGV